MQITQFFAVFFICIVSIQVVLPQEAPQNQLERQILYAPAREAYNKKIGIQKKEKKKGCIFCHQLQEKNDKKNILLARFKHTAVWLNLYPYNKGHLLIMPKQHVKDLDALSKQEKTELFEIIIKTPNILKDVLGAEGTNIGINLGKIGGASKPDHLHIHAIPRYSHTHPNRLQIGFIHTVGETQVVQWSMEKLYALLKAKYDLLKQQINLE